jgi:hypothetical protein
MAQTKYDIAKIIQRFFPELESTSVLSGHQKSILNLMSLCKTAALGGPREQCNKCAFTRIHYNSCGNRNCPTCQGVSKEKWIFARQQDLLPVKYFHCVFTIPSELYIYFRYNKKLLFDLQMRSVKDTLLAFGMDPKHGIGGKIGAVLLLHTWTQQMTFHPHVHCIVPAGGINKDGQWKHSKSKGNFLFPAAAMSKLFRGKLLAGIHQLYTSGELILPENVRASYKSLKNKLYKTKWVSYAKKAFGGPDQVLEYLGRYTHKICISNYRILKITSTHVTFRYTDRKVNKSKVKTITGVQFLKLFAEHILPKGFVKIRHIGFLASRAKAKYLALARKSLNAPPPPPKVKMTTRDFITMSTGKDPYRCPCCGKGEMVIIEIILAIRGSPAKIPLRFMSKERKINI